MINKYNMSLEENIFLAKRKIVDYIWKSARLEGLNITFSQTSVIYDKGILNNADIHIISVVLNLKHAWQLLLSTINQSLNLEYICKIHYEIAKDEALTWGKLRTGQVGISGTDYIPPIPQENIIREEIQKLLEIKNPTQRAIKLMFYLMKGQLFWDGNKRTSIIIANKIMIENGCGIITIPINEIENFNVILSEYYTNNTLDKAVEYIYNNCIDGITFEKEKTESIDNIQENSINKICINTDNINNLNIEDERIR